MIVAVGLDISTHFGIVALRETSIFGPPELLHEEEAHFPKLRDQLRMGALATRMLKVLDDWEPKIVVIEGYAFAAKGAITILAEITGVLKYFLVQRDCPFIVVPPTQLKKFVAGTGRSTKDQIMVRILNHCGHESKPT